MPTNPFATGAGGADFETRVATALTCYGIVGLACPPLTAPATGVWLQADHLGCRLDDVVLESHGVAGRQRVLCSVKSSLRLVPSDEDFREVMQRGWADFGNSDVFDPRVDFLCLVVSSTRTDRINRLVRLTELARACRDAADFEHRLGQTGAINQDVKTLHRDIVAVTGQADRSEAVALEEIFRYLRRFHTSAFDLDQDISHDRARVIGILTLASGGSDAKSAESCWNAVFERFSSAKATGKCFGTEELAELAREHGIRRDGVQSAARGLGVLRQHCQRTRGNIRSTLGVADLHLDRPDPRADLRDALDTHRAILLAGAAGVGKSALALEVADAFVGGERVFCFMAEEFGQSHLDYVLQAAGLRDLVVEGWFQLMASSPWVLLVDAVEHLLEADRPRTAFAQFLRAVRSDPHCHLILTCRDYLADQARSFEEEIFPWRIVEVTPLPLAVVRDVSLGTTLPREWLDQTVVAEALRNPKWLDLSLRAMARTGEVLSHSTWARLADWRNFVWNRLLSEGASAAGRHARERLLVGLAARAGSGDSAWVEVEVADEREAVALTGLGLLRRSHLHPGRFRPDHDLIADWALLRHVEARFDDLHRDPAAFVAVIGGSAVVRRAFRHVFGELLDGPRQDRALGFLRSSLAEEAMPMAWREEAVIALMGAANVSEVLEKTLPLWLSNDAVGFDLLVHCLRVSYLGRPLTDVDEERPTGPGWAALLEFIGRRGPEFLVPRVRQIVALLLDWRKAVQPHHPEPAGVASAGALVRQLWGMATGGEEDFEDRFGEGRPHGRAVHNPLALLVASVSGALDQEFFDAALHHAHERPDFRAREGWQAHRQARELIEFLVTDRRAWPLARAHPHTMTSICERSYGLDVEPRVGNYASDYSDRGCGLHTSRFAFAPPCALRGPFLALLRFHPKLGEDFILRLNDEAMRRYASHPPQNSLVAPVAEIIFRQDGEEFTQLADEGWWRCYRGWSPYPHVLECSLMALEKWLLEDVAVERPEALEATLKRLLRGTGNVAVTAVVASVVTAHPTLCGSVSATMLSCPDLIRLDRQRWMNDQTRQRWGGGGFRDDYPCAVERGRSDALPHRAESLENAILRAQFGPARDELWGVLDEYHRALEAFEDDSEEIRLFRLLIHRLDARNLVAHGLVDEPSRVLLQSKPPSEDLQRYVAESEVEMDQRSLPMRLNVWASQLFDPISFSTSQPELWREMLGKAREMRLDRADGDHQLVFGDTPALVAAVCIRDQWAAMDAAERDWCLRETVSVLLGDRELTLWQKDGGLPLFSREDGAAAFAVGRLCLLLEPGHPDHEPTWFALAVALTHPEQRFVLEAAKGFGLLPTPEMGERQLAAAELIIKHARLCRSVDHRYRGREIDEDLDWQHRRAAMHAEILSEGQRLRERFAAGVPAEKGSLSKFYPRGFEEEEVFPALLTVVGQTPGATAGAVFSRAAGWLAIQWRRETSHHDGRFGRDRWRDHDLPASNAMMVKQVSDLVARRVLCLESDQALAFVQPLFDGLRVVYLGSQAKQPLKSLCLNLDHSGRVETFWALWGKFQDAALGIGSQLHRPALWQGLRLSEQRALEAFSALTSAVFLNDMYWQPGQKWAPLAGHEQKFATAFANFGPIGFHRYVKFLDTIGGELLPGAWPALSDCLRQVEERGVGHDTLTRPVTGNLLHLLRTQVVKLRIPADDQRAWSAVRHLLDLLVGAGSAEAFRLREDLPRTVRNSS